MTGWTSIRIVQTALDELRGIDRALLIELEESTGDPIIALNTVSRALAGFLRAPSDLQILLLSLGSTDDESLQDALIETALLKLLGQREDR